MYLKNFSTSFFRNIIISIILYLMLRFSKFEQYELLEVQSAFENIQFLKKNDYIKDLDDEEIEEIKYYKKLFQDIANDFEKIGI